MQSDSHDGNIALPRIIRVGQGSQRLSMFVAWDLCLWLGTSCFSFVPPFAKICPSLEVEFPLLFTVIVNMELRSFPCAMLKCLIMQTTSSGHNLGRSRTSVETCRQIRTKPTPIQPDSVGLLVPIQLPT